MKARLIFFIVVAVTLFLWKVNLYQRKITYPIGQLSFPTPVIVSPTSYLLTQESEGSVNFQDTDIAVVSKEWAPTITWTSPTSTFWDENYYPQPIPGKIISGSVVAENFEWYGFNFLSYHNSKYSNLGWTESSIAADRPGASQWGFQRQEGELMQSIVFNYLLDAKTEELEPGVGGVKFVCPCTHRVSIFLSDQFPSSMINSEETQ